MKPGGGKHKGSSFERQVCRDLSKWITYGRRDDLFWRSAMSGGVATVGKKAGIDRAAQSGDISAISDGGFFGEEAGRFIGKVSVECKFLSDYKMARLIEESSGLLADAILQSRKAAGKNRWSMVVAKSNRRPVIAVLDLSLAEVLYAKFPQGATTIFHPPHSSPLRSEPIVIVRFDEFVKTARAARIKRQTKRVKKKQ